MTAGAGLATVGDMIRIALIAALLAGPAAAQERTASHCIALAEAPGVELLQRASFGEPLDDFTVRLSYVNHAMFLIETPGGATAVTDYTGFLGSGDLVPDVATMNHAHSSHWTPNPDPRIPHVMKGWGGSGQAVEVADLFVRNVPTDIRGRMGGVEVEGNSIFVFEAEGLCIGHLGHLHHEPDEAQYAALGRVDVVMAPVDGGLTLPRETLRDVLTRLRSSVVIPMHWFGVGNLEAFLAEMGADYPVERVGGPSIEVSLRTLPDRPTIMVLDPAFLSDPE